jgi:hypothetical protein
MGISRSGLLILLSQHRASLLTSVDRAAIVPTELAARSGLGLDQVQVSEKYGGGFPANVEGLHHLHCLVGSTKAPAT